MKKNLLWQKLSLIFIGIILSFVILEVILRCGGFICLSIQEYRNNLAIQRKEVVRIICFGESTTMLGGEDSYPAQLERILNEKSKQIKFSVINKGMAGSNTGVITSRLQENLEKYQPDIVVAMMGVNDGLGTIRFEEDSPQKKGGLLESLRIVKMAVLIKEHIQQMLGDGGRKEDSQILRAMQKEESADIEKYLSDVVKVFGEGGEDEYDLFITLGMRLLKKSEFVRAGQVFQKAIDLRPKDSQAHLASAWNDMFQGKFAEAQEKFQEILKMDPLNSQVYYQVGLSYKVLGEWDESLWAYRKGIELNPEDFLCYYGLGWIYMDSGKFADAKKMFQKAIEVNPKDDGSYYGLGWNFMNQGKHKQAQEMFERAIAINPGTFQSHYQLGWSYLFENQFDRAEEIFKKALRIDPRNEEIRAGLGWCYIKQKKFGQAEKILKRALKVTPHNDMVYLGLAHLYQRWGKKELSRIFFLEADTLAYNSITKHNYKKFKEILLSKNKKIVFVQYPMRSVKPLKKMLGIQEDVFFVDNQESFRQAVDTNGYDTYFWDMFAGDFGHCSPEGNRLLAENIARVILKECFN